MTIRLILLGLACAAMAATAQAGNDWRAQVDQLIDQGEFARAERVMKQLPGKVRKQQAVTIDSLNQIMERIGKDFNMTPEQGMKAIHDKYPQVTPEQIQHWKQSRALEVMRIDGQERWFRKSVRNLWLLGDEFKQENRRNSDAEAGSYLNIFRQAMAKQPDAHGVRDWRHVNRCRCRAGRRDAACVDAFPL